MELAALVVLIVVVAVVGWRMRRDLRQQHLEQLAARLLTTFGSAVARADPRELLAWRGVVDGTRQLYPEACAELDAATGESVPFSRELVQAAHARWTADWLVWERQHDRDFKLEASVVEKELRRRGEETSSEGRARLAAIEEQKLQVYQQRYEEYVRVANGLMALDKRAAG